MITFSETIIETCYEPKSLCWSGGDLYDWAGGGHFTITGEKNNLRKAYGYRFDYAVSSPDGIYVALMERLGTKGVILKDGNLLREINRSYYKADAFDYPLAFMRRPGGEMAVAHCPREYNRLEIEDAETGELLTGKIIEEPDFFHSHLMVSPGGRFLLSAGWYWHPLDELRVYDLHALFSHRPEEVIIFDSGALAKGLEITAATFTQGGTLLFATGSDMLADDGDEQASSHPFTPTSLVHYDLAGSRILSSSNLEKSAGVVMAGDGYTVIFSSYPAVIEIATGRVMTQLDHLDSGDRLSSISCNSQVPVMALDPRGARFALVQGKRIHVVQLSS